VILTGPVPHPDVPFYLAAADVLALPNTATEEISARYTSPLKLFEAMAAERAIVASDVPSLREVLEDDVNAALAPADDAEAWSRVLNDLLDDEPRRERLAARARQDVEPYDWGERGRRVAWFLRERLAVGAG
jgi:glycosyltransferase involved in cell wall biosynthesis